MTATRRKKKPAAAKRKSTHSKKTRSKGAHRTAKPASFVSSDSRSQAFEWFAGLSHSLASPAALQERIQQARTFDLVGLSTALGDEAEALALNKKANDLITAEIVAAGAESERAFKLKVLRDILNDS